MLLLLSSIVIITSNLRNLLGSWSLWLWNDAWEQWQCVGVEARRAQVTGVGDRVNNSAKIFRYQKESEEGTKLLRSYSSTKLFLKLLRKLRHIVPRSSPESGQSTQSLPFHDESPDMPPPRPRMALAAKRTLSVANGSVLLGTMPPDRTLTASVSKSNSSPYRKKKLYRASPRSKMSRPPFEARGRRTRHVAYGNRCHTRQQAT